jgi:hypothetical protein
MLGQEAEGHGFQIDRQWLEWHPSSGVVRSA